MSHFEAMAAYLSHTPTDDHYLEQLLQDTEPDPEFGHAVERLARASWAVVIVSAGSSWYIERILERAGARAIVHSNPGSLKEGHGLVLQKPEGSPFYSPDVGIDKSAVVHDALGRYSQVAFAGDGPPDLAPALLVRSEMRFARGHLADELHQRGEKFQLFDKWSEIADRLAG